MQREHRPQKEPPRREQECQVTEGGEDSERQKQKQKQDGRLSRERVKTAKEIERTRQVADRRTIDTEPIDILLKRVKGEGRKEGKGKILKKE